FPELTSGTAGPWLTQPANAWTSGFFPGELWMAYQATGDDSFRQLATRWQAPMARERTRTGTADLGFMLLDSYGLDARATGSSAAQSVLVTAAESMASRYRPKVGMLRCWGTTGDPQVQVIVDDLVSLELLFWAADHGGPAALRTEAISHALRTAHDFLRPDGSVYHRVTYDDATGDVVSKDNIGGYSDQTVWSRGQAWAMYGFAMVYRHTRDPRFLDAAEQASDYFLAHLPADDVPPWDFGAPGADQPKDSSAAAIAASALEDLSVSETDSTRAYRYAAAGRTIVSSLGSPAYQTTGPADEAILRHGTLDQPGGRSDTGLVYGDYYYLEALLRQRWLAPQGVQDEIKRLTSSGGAPSGAGDGNRQTAWVAPSSDAWLQADLGTARSVGSVTITWLDGNLRATQFDIQASVDGSHWTPLETGLSIGDSNRPETYAVPFTKARYLRVDDHGSLAGGRTGIRDLQVRAPWIGAR
ncbi:MAG TPA: discoidin domain-containing protein, partial [Acidimicrobiales bacterium]